MKTWGQPPSVSEGPYPRDEELDFVDVYTKQGQDDGHQYQYQYQEYDVNKFLDNVLTGVVTGTDEIQRLGKALRKACQEGDLVQLVRGGLHLVELYQALKRGRSRSRSTAVGVGRTAPSKKRTRPSRKAVGERRRGRVEGAVPHGRNVVQDPTKLEGEENVGTSGQDLNENKDLQDLEPSVISKQDEIDTDNDNQEDGNTFEAIGDSSSSRPNKRAPEDEATSPLDLSYRREGPRALKRRRLGRKNRETSELEQGPNGGENSSSSSESDVSSRRGRYYSSSTESDVSQEKDSSSDDHEGGKAIKRQQKTKDVPKNGEESLSSDISPKTEEPSTSTSTSTSAQIGRKAECPVCGRVCPSKWHLERHSRVHTGERPFPCPHPNCPKKYKSKRPLEHHLLSHEGSVSVQGAPRNSS